MLRTVALPSALRWSIVVASMGYQLEFWRSLLLILIGYFFNLTIVSSIGGDGVRMWKAHRAGLPTVIAVSSVMIERLAQVLAHFLIVTASIPILFYRIHDPVIRSGMVLLVALAAIGFAILLQLDLLPAPLQKFRIIATSARFAKDLRHVLLVPATAVTTIVLGFANQITVVAVVAILAAGLGLSVDFLDCLIIVPAALLLTALPITIAGWGLREGAFVVGFSYLGIGSNDALTLSLLFGFLNLIVRLPGRSVVAPDH